MAADLTREQIEEGARLSLAAAADAHRLEATVAQGRWKYWAAKHGHALLAMASRVRELEAEVARLREEVAGYRVGSGRVNE